MSYITLGAGCFWGVQNILSKLPGIKATEVGYMGGRTDHPSYEQICRGDTGHAEVVRVEFDSSKISLKEILAYFWRLHDPTTLNKQGYDIGSQYRSVVFYHEPEDRNIIQASKKEFNDSGVFSKPAVTEILPADTFWKGEDYHQNYFDKKYQGDAGPTCHMLRER